MRDDFVYTPALVAEVIDIGLSGTHDLDVIEMVADVERALLHLPAMERYVTLQVTCGVPPESIALLRATSVPSIRAVVASTYARVATILNG